MIALPALTVAGAAIGSTRVVQIMPGWIERATIWATIIARSGTTKSPAARPILAPLRRAQSKALTAHDDAMKNYEAEV